MTTRVKSVGIASPFNTNSTDQIVVPVPTAAATNGRVMLMTVSVDRPTSGASVTTPTGWTLVRSDTVAVGAGSILQAVYVRQASSEPLSYTVTGSTISNFSAALVVFEGVDTAVPVNAHAGATNASGTDPVLSAPSVTTTIANTAVESLFACFDISPPTLPTPAGTTVRVTGGEASNSVVVRPLRGWFTAEQGAAGATTARSGTGNVAQTVALQPINRAPDAPALLSPVGGVTVDRAAAIRLSWDFSDPDEALTGGDSQSAYGVQYRLVGAGTWTTASGTTAAFHDLAAGLAAGNYEWQARTTDALGLVGTYSSSGFFTSADAPVAPVLTSALADGGTVTSGTSLESWTHPAADTFNWRVVGDLAGIADPSVIFTSGLTASLSVQAPYPTNNVTRHFQVQAVRSGLVGPWATRRRVVAYVQPPTPTAVLTVSNALAQITVAITNPTPAGGQPVVTSNDLFRRQGGIGEGVRIATLLAAGATFTDRTPASGVNYSYLVVAVGANGTTSQSGWSGELFAPGSAYPLVYQPTY